MIKVLFNHNAIGDVKYKCKRTVEAIKQMGVKFKNSSGRPPSIQVADTFDKKKQKKTNWSLTVNNIFSCMSTPHSIQRPAFNILPNSL